MLCTLFPSFISPSPINTFIGRFSYTSGGIGFLDALANLKALTALASGLFAPPEDMCAPLVDTSYVIFVPTLGLPLYFHSLNAFFLSLKGLSNGDIVLDLVFFSITSSKLSSSCSPKSTSSFTFSSSRFSTSSSTLLSGTFGS